jgi:hypothetical protein
MRQQTMMTRAMSLASTPPRFAAPGGPAFFANMLRRVVVLSGWLLACGPASAVSNIGAVDSLNAAGASGWACMADGTGPVRVAAYAGAVLLGVYPTTVSRPDVLYACPGLYLRGFSLVFDPATQAMFAWQTQITLYEVADGTPPRLLPPSSRGVANPTPLPSGALQRIDANGNVEGTVLSGGKAPLVQLFAGGGLGIGQGSLWQPAVPAAPDRFTFHIAVPGDMTNPGSVLPVFASVQDAQGAALPLASPMELAIGANGVAQAAAIVPLSGVVAQGGTMSGITNTLLTAWLPAGQAFGGLAGLIGLSGNDTTFSEAYVLLGTADYGQEACAALNTQTVAQPPGMTRLWAGILKTNATGQVTIPASVALANPVVPAPQGTCLMALVSAGYAVLNSNPARYTTTRVRLYAQTVAPPAGSPVVKPFGMGGEFRVPVSAAPVGVYVGIMASRALAVDGIAGAQSAAPVVGANPQTGWQPAPDGAWSVNTEFVYLPAPACAAAGFATQPPSGDYSVLRQATPAPLSLPRGAVILMRMPMQSVGIEAVQRSTYKALPAGTLPAGFSGTLAAGDCLVAYNFAVGAPGVLDVENQSTVYFREVP